MSNIRRMLALGVMACFAADVGGNQPGLGGHEVKNKDLPGTDPALQPSTGQAGDGTATHQTPSTVNPAGGQESSRDPASSGEAGDLAYQEPTTKDENAELDEGDEDEAPESENLDDYPED